MVNTLRHSDINYLELIMGFHRSMSENRLNLIYEGEINQSITRAFTTLAEQNLNEDNEEKSVVRKVYHVMVECLQNIYKHSDPRAANTPGKRSYGIILIGHDDDGYIISTGNAVDKDQERVLRKMLDNVNALNSEELNAVYKKQMREGMLSDKGGAGLGFIDISRKTGSKLEYEFLPLNDNASFFVLKTYIAK